MQRIVQGSSATLSHTFLVDGVPTNPSPDAATITITRADGTVLVASTAATEAGTGIVTYTLTPAQTALLDTLTVAWTATFGGQAQAQADVIEIAGGVLFTIADARARAPLADMTGSPAAYSYSSATIVDARTWAEQEIEDACGAAFVPRYARETLVARGTRGIRLGHRRVRTIRTLSIDGTTVDAGYLAALYVDAGTLMSFSRYAYWPWGARLIIGYEHGYDTPPRAASVAALDLARDRLISDAGSATIDPRAERIITDDGTIALRPGSDRFGLPSVDAAVASLREAMVA
jgi:hypothetical protein